VPDLNVNNASAMALLRKAAASHAGIADERRVDWNGAQQQRFDDVWTTL
jgi:hypothetical protein